jgi:hypothetical protein
MHWKEGAEERGNSSEHCNFSGKAYHNIILSEELIFVANKYTYSQLSTKTKCFNDY